MKARFSPPPPVLPHNRILVIFFLLALKQNATYVLHCICTCQDERFLPIRLRVQIAVLPVASLKSSFYSLFLMFLAKRICERSVEM
jgi:hypothetical protein